MRNETDRSGLARVDLVMIQSTFAQLLRVVLRKDDRFAPTQIPHDRRRVHEQNIPVGELEIAAVEREFAALLSWKLSHPCVAPQRQFELASDVLPE